MKYVDGYVFVVPKKNVPIYKKMARQGGKLWKKHGALEYFECIGDDIHPAMNGMKTSSFPKITKLNKNETVWFSFIIYKSKKHRNQVNAKVMKDPAMKPENWEGKKMPFSMNKFAYAGFKVMVEK